MRKTKKEMLMGLGTIDKSRLLKGNTVVYRNAFDDNVYIRFHKTDILKFDGDGNVTLNSGGYHTITTKARLNEFQRVAYVYQEDFTWYVRLNDGSVIDFYDGMKINLDTGRRII